VPDSPDGYPQGVEVFADRDSLARAAAEHFATLAAEAMAHHSRFSVALSGGSTPRDMHALLANNPLAGCIDWTKVYVFWGDERCVPPDHPDSNYRMARETLLDHVPVPRENVFRIRGEIDPGQAAHDYEQVLRDFFGPSAEPRFDLILLGIGNDAHTASLFPGTDAIHEGIRWVAGHYVEKLNVWRVTLTPVVINAAANVTFVVAGAGKAESLKDVLTGPYRPDLFPSQIVRPDTGRLRWMVDSSAAALLRADGPGQTE
jgi:6-phosphogluconolactonase